MKHQIALVGGQILPIFLGVKEFEPDVVHLVVTKESGDKLSYLLHSLEGYRVKEYFCGAYDVSGITEICRGIIAGCTAEDGITFNLTGGTKLMLIAAQAVLIEHGLKGFYLNIGNMLTEIPSYTQRKLQYQTATNDFFKLSGHGIASFRVLDDYSAEDLEVAGAIQTYSGESKEYSLITAHFRENVKSMKKSGREVLANGICCEWSPGNLIITLKDGKIREFNSPLVKELFFFGGWWELLVGTAIVGWDATQEILMQIVLPFRADIKQPKNEIDILINRNNKLIFVECKSGIVSQADINKIKSVRDTFGGNASKSILVSQHQPKTTLMEKCKELGIGVFYLIGEDGKSVKTFEELIEDLRKLDGQLGI
ncbi:DUF1887 family protein [Pedobacter frigiditerrae]|uniref:DUF1887 family protein n=1 Tax=Pedobacter frigiditerrae TaxID=2530452 RepID=A0A4V2MIZ6_9SPHI|nr:DUF1887 family CARF protein [Pedobacter frigiditerrae]TCC92406.1 DUF1887 family protein [Pedobacter frigiditerrae]